MGIDLNTVHMGVDASGVPRVKRIREESLPFRQRLLDELGQDIPVVGTSLGTNFDLKTIPALRDCLFHHFEVAFHAEPGEAELVPKVAPGFGHHVRDKHGNLVMEERVMFNGPPFAQLNVDMKHDGHRWEARMMLYDLRGGRGGEPVFTDESAADSLEEIASRVVPAIRARVADIHS